MSPQTLDLYAGTYEFPEAGGLTLSVTRAENKLYAAESGSAPQELLPLSTTRFFVPAGYDFYQLDFAGRGHRPDLPFGLDPVWHVRHRNEEVRWPGSFSL